MGVLGAALATVLAQVIVTVTFLYIMIKSKAEYLKINILSGIKINCMKTLFHIDYRQHFRVDYLLFFQCL